MTALRWASVGQDNCRQTGQSNWRETKYGGKIEARLVQCENEVGEHFK